MTDIRHILELASDTTPREADPVGAVLRRHQGVRRRTAVRTGVASLAAAAVATVAFGATALMPHRGGTAPASPPLVAPSLPVPSSAASPAVDPGGGLNGVSLDAPDLKIRLDGDECGVPGTVAVLPDATGIGSCGTGPSATITRLTRRDWATGQHSAPGLVIRDSTAVWITAPSGPYGGYATMVVPSRGVVVTIYGDEQQRLALLDAVRITSAEPTDAVFASPQAPVLAVLSPAIGDWVGLTRDPELLGDLVQVLEEAPRVQRIDDRTCTPDPASAVFLDLTTSENSDPQTGPVQDFTHLALDLSGQCGLVFSSTGAVLQPDRRILDPLLHGVRSSSE